MDSEARKSLRRPIYRNAWKHAKETAGLSLAGFFAALLFVVYVWRRAGPVEAMSVLETTLVGGACIAISASVLWLYGIFRELEDRLCSTASKLQQIRNTAGVRRHINERIAAAKRFADVHLLQRKPPPTDKGLSSAAYAWLEDTHEFLGAAFSWKESADFEDAAPVDLARLDSLPSVREALRRRVNHLEGVYARFEAGTLQADATYAATSWLGERFLARIGNEYDEGRRLLDRCLAAENGEGDEGKWGKLRDEADAWQERLHLIVGIGDLTWPSETGHPKGDRVFASTLPPAFNPPDDLRRLRSAIRHRVIWMERKLGSRCVCGEWEPIDPRRDDGD